MNDPREALLRALATEGEHMTTTDRSRDRLEVFADTTGQWRWRRIAANNQIIAVSGEGYIHRDHATDMAQSINPALDLTFHADTPKDHA